MGYATVWLIEVLTYTLVSDSNTHSCKPIVWSFYIEQIQYTDPLDKLH